MARETSSVSHERERENFRSELGIRDERSGELACIYFTRRWNAYYSWERRERGENGRMYIVY